MKKALPFLPLALLVSYTSSGQVKSLLESASVAALAPTGEEKSQRLDPKVFDYLYAKKITYAITGERNLSSLGSFAAVNITKPTATVGFTKVFPKDAGAADKEVTSAISVSATGGFNENTVSVFSNTKLNKSAELRLNYSYIPKGNRRYWVKSNSEDVKLADRRLAEVERYFVYKRWERDAKEAKWRADISAIQAKYGQSSEAILSNPATSLEDKSKLSQAQYELDVIVKDKGKMPAVLTDPDKSSLGRAHFDSLKSISNDYIVSSMRFFWLDFFATVKYQRYYTYEGAALYDKQLIKSNLTHYRFGSAFNYFLDSKSAWRRIFLRGELSYGLTNNTDQLQTSVVNTITQTNNLGNAQNFRHLEDEVSAYTLGDYRQFHSTNIKLDAIKPLSGKGGESLHLYYTLLMPKESTYTDSNERSNPLYNVQDVGLGFIFSINDKEKAKALVNIEPYFTLKDITDEYDQKVEGRKLTTFQRNEVGIRVAVPFGHLSSTSDIK